MGCADPPFYPFKGVGAPNRRTPSVPSRFGSKLPLPLYADVRLHIPMTRHMNHHDVRLCSGIAARPNVSNTAKL